MSNGLSNFGTCFKSFAEAAFTSGNAACSRGGYSAEAHNSFRPIDDMRMSSALSILILKSAYADAVCTRIQELVAIGRNRTERDIQYTRHAIAAFLIDACHSLSVATPLNEHWQVHDSITLLHWCFVSIRIQ
jgi:hypothetical protein